MVPTQDSAGAVILRLIEGNHLTNEQLLGIEHLVSRTALTNLCAEKHEHVRLVVRLQGEMKENSLSLDEFSKAVAASSSKQVIMA
jgi:hypothetical protein